MKKEFYKLSLVFIIIVFSFSLAFFLGREITLSEQKNIKKTELSKDTMKKKWDDQSDSLKLSQEKKEQTQREKVNEYKKTLSHEKSISHKKSNKKSDNQDMTKNPKQQNEQANEMYGLLITTHDDKESAMKKSTQLKIRFPQWHIFFKKVKNSYKVYIGPFRTSASAKKFMDGLKEKPEFSSLKVEKI